MNHSGGGSHTPNRGGGFGRGRGKAENRLSAGSEPGPFRSAKSNPSLIFFFLSFFLFSLLFFSLLSFSFPSLLIFILDLLTNIRRSAETPQKTPSLSAVGGLKGPPPPVPAHGPPIRSLIFFFFFFPPSLFFPFIFLFLLLLCRRRWTTSHAPPTSQKQQRVFYLLPSSLPLPLPLLLPLSFPSLPLPLTFPPSKNRIVRSNSKELSPPLYRPRAGEGSPKRPISVQYEGERSPLVGAEPGIPVWIYYLIIYLFITS